jgi:hypothetical protein
MDFGVAHLQGAGTKTQTGIVLLTNVSAFLASKGDYIVKMARALYDPLVASRERSLPGSRN